MNGLRGERLTSSDYASLAARWIDPETADHAFLRRLTQEESCAILGRNGKASYEGIGIPYIWPGTDFVRETAVRRDHPEIENGKPRRKYLAPPGRGNMLYFPPGIEQPALEDATLPLLITEGPFKALALYRLSQYELGEQQSYRFLPCALSGVWNFRGTIGKTTSSDGARIDEVGVIPDFSRIVWKGRKVTICFDIDWSTNESVKAALWTLTRELQSRGSEVYWFDWPTDSPEPVKGIDDLLAAIGPEKVLELLGKARHLRPKATDWRVALVVNEKTRVPLQAFINAVYALRLSPDWGGVIGFDEFRRQTVARSKTPWGYEGVWSDDQDLCATQWLSEQAIRVTDLVAGKAVQRVAYDHKFNPVRDYLESLDWDGHPRLDSWLTDYFGSENNLYISAIGKKWMISAVARVYQPGCQADHVLVLEGPQGQLKSSALKILGDPWYTDDVSDLGTKDAAIQIRSAWIAELGELDALTRAEVSKVKAFITRRVDRYRPPYGRHLIEAPRQGVFAGTVNESQYLTDPTGGRRFWPFVVTTVALEALRTDRDQLWAEAAYLYKRGIIWWINEPEILAVAKAEQRRRYKTDAWESRVLAWIDGRSMVSIPQILELALGKPIYQCTQVDSNRIAHILKSNGWEKARVRTTDGLEWAYRPQS